MAFGDFLKIEESPGTSTNSTLNFQEKLRLTTDSIDAGNYRIGFSWLYGHSSTTSDVEVQVEEDDTTEIYRMRVEPKDGASDIRSPAAGFRRRTLTAGVHTFDIDFRSTTGGGNTARITDAYLEFWKVD